LQGTRFGPYELRLSSRELYKFGTKVKLRPQPFQVLSLLLDHPGDVVTREQLRQQLWPSDTFVDFEHSLNTAIKELRGVLNDSATDSRFIETLPKLGYRFIFPVEHSAPNGQPSPVAAAVEPEATRHPILADHVTTLPAHRALRWTWLSLAAALVLLFGIVMVVARLGVFRHSASGAASAALKPRPSIAVLGFKNLSRKPDDEWMSTAMAEMLGAELASGQQIRVIPSENIARMKLDLSLAPTDTYGQETLSKVHNHLGTDMVTSGSYLTLPDGSSTKLRIILQVQDTRTGETIAAITEDGTESDLPQLISAGGDNLRHTLGIGSLSAAATREVRASFPANSEAERLYAEGLAKLQGFDALAARELFEKAIAADPNHALSHSALADTLSHLGYDFNAQAEAKKALDLSSNLSREDKLSIEGRLRELTHDRDGAAEIYRTLHNFFPDNLDYGLRFARAEYLANHANDALDTVAALRKLPAPMSSDPRIDLVESHAAERLGDMKRSQKAAAAGIARAKTLGSGLLLASSLTAESWAWSNLGELNKAIDDESQARDLYAAAGDTYEAAVAANGIGMCQKNKGDLIESRKSLEAALAEFRRSGAQWNIASCSNHLGELSQETGDLDQARSHLEEALQIQRSLQDKRGVAADLDNLSNVELSAGRLSAARKMKEESLRDFREVGDKRGESITLVNLAEVLYQQGELASARETYSQSIVNERAISHKSSLAYSLVGLAEVQTAQDQLSDALASTQESMTLCEQTKEEVHSAESDVQLAIIAVEQGKPVEAESLARKAVAIFEQHKSPGSASIADSVLARSLLAQGKLTDARAAADRAATLAHQGSDRMILMTAGFAKAEVDTGSGKAADAERNLSALHDQAKRDGYVAFELEARLLLARAEIESGKLAAAQAHLDKLQTDARNKGFLLIARKAHVASSR
jgi:DNA-binding winged helix-turn-helix (wHTH) protein/tetratricopeptide (TPR) repeat protein/TolB-like protein